MAAILRLENSGGYVVVTEPRSTDMARHRGCIIAGHAPNLVRVQECPGTASTEALREVPAGAAPRAGIGDERAPPSLGSPLPPSGRRMREHPRRAAAVRGLRARRRARRADCLRFGKLAP